MVVTFKLSTSLGERLLLFGLLLLVAFLVGAIFEPEDLSNRPVRRRLDVSSLNVWRVIFVYNLAPYGLECHTGRISVVRLLSNGTGS